MQTTFSTTFILRTAKTRDGLTPVYCRITVAGNRSGFSIKSVPEKSWDVGKVKGNNEDSKSNTPFSIGTNSVGLFPLLSLLF